MKAQVLVRILIAAAMAFSAHAQSLRFEVASIRPAGNLREQDEANPSFRAYRAGTAKSFCMACISGTHYDNYGMPLRVMIGEAYRIDPRLITGPAWLFENSFESSFAIHAVMPEGATRDKIPEMLRALLEERFHLRVHTGTAQQTGYALTVAKNGPRLKAAREMERSGCESWVESFTGNAKPNLLCQSVRAEGDGEVRTAMMTNGPYGPTVNAMRMAGSFETHSEYFRITMDLLAKAAGEALSSVGTMVRVVNQSGLEGEWDVVLDRVYGDFALAVVSGSLEKQGLRLEKISVPVEALVVDSVDRMPTEN